MAGSNPNIPEFTEPCSHDSRFKIQSKSNICLCCQCNKLDELLKRDCAADQKLSSEVIREVIHEVRIMNSILDAADESLVETLLTPVLRTLAGFLGKLHGHPETLRLLFTDNTGTPFCSMIKRLLYSHSAQIKSAALHLINCIILTHKQALSHNDSDRAFVGVLSIMSQIDLIHFITDAMNTSSEDMFRTAVDILNEIGSIQVFGQGWMIPVLEATLRNSTMLVPDQITSASTYSALNKLIFNISSCVPSLPSGIQYQLMTLVERLPTGEWTPVETIAWIKLLPFCTDAQLQARVNRYLISQKDFIQLLGNRLRIAKMDSTEAIDEFIYSHKVLSILIARNSDTFPQCTSTSASSSITWKLSSTLCHIHEIPRMEIFEFLLSICKVNFRCPLIQVEELERNTDGEFAKVLLNLLFHLQALSHKVVLRDVKEAVWQILYEILRFASEQRELMNLPRFQTDVLFQPWVKVTLTQVLAECRHLPSKAPLNALEFMEKWTMMMLTNKLENPSNRNAIQQCEIFQNYNILFTTIRDDMKKDPSQILSVDEKQTAAGTSRQTLFSTKTTENSCSLFDIERKSELIFKIAKNCDEFISLSNK